MSQSSNSKLSLTDISGIGESTKQDLLDHGFTNPVKIANSTVKELKKVPGIGTKKAEKYIEMAKKLVEGAGITTDAKTSEEDTGVTIATPLDDTSDEEVIYMTRYERARIVGARALQISHGAPELIVVESGDFRPIDLAKKELEARVLPLGLSRRYPNGQVRSIPLQKLRDKESISDLVAS